MRNALAVMVTCCLAACGQGESPKQQEKSFGGQVGDAYKGMLDEARQGAGQINEQMQDTQQAVRDRNR
jgi:hypothetical protein